MDCVSLLRAAHLERSIQGGGLPQRQLIVLQRLAVGKCRHVPRHLVAGVPGDAQIRHLLTRDTLLLFLAHADIAWLCTVVSRNAAAVCSAPQACKSEAQCAAASQGSG